jgi:hypothetical protein
LLCWISRFALQLQQRLHECGIVCNLHASLALWASGKKISSWDLIPFSVILLFSHVKLTKLPCHAPNGLSLHDELQIVMYPHTIEIPKTGPLTITPGSPGLAEMNPMNPPTLKIQTKHTLAETCANKNVVPKSLNCNVPRFICTSAPLVNTVQGGKKVAMMTSSTMLTCSALVLACFTHDNALCNKEDGALAFEKAVRPFLPWMLLLAHACSSQKIYERPVRAYPWILTKYV